MRIKTQILAASAFISVASCSGSDGNKDAELEPLLPPSSALERLAGFSGEYIIVDARRASDVATTALDFKPPIGERIRFTYDGIELTDVECDEWKVISLDAPVIFIDSDPNLTDLNLGPTDSPITSGDQREKGAYVASCEGEDVFRFQKVDDRVLIVSSGNSAVNLILERPLTNLQIKAYQSQLKSMKFYDGELTGELDEATLRASRNWYIDRAGLDEVTPIPARPAITENLLDSLGVLQNTDTK